MNVYFSVQSKRAPRRVLLTVLAVLHVLAPIMVKADSATAIVSVSAGKLHTCAVLDDGTVRCWGLNDSGQLGDSTTTDRASPVSVIGITNATAISAGSFHSCALLADGRVKCWGYNQNGQLGDSAATPAFVAGLSDAIAVEAEGGWSNFALLSAGTVQSWGNPQTIDPAVPSPATVPVPGIHTAVGMDASPSHACAVLKDGTVKCWGYNTSGQLGDGTTTDRESPVSVIGITNATAVSVGHDHTCALLSDGTVKCWGDESVGQLGPGITFTDTLNGPFISTSPITVSGITHARRLDASATRTCAVISDGTVKCWGLGEPGLLGDGRDEKDGEVIYEPRSVSGLNNAIDVSVGESHTCAMLSGDTLTCWGSSNGYGQLGDGTTHPHFTPIAVIIPTIPAHSGRFTPLFQQLGLFMRNMSKFL